MSDGSKIEWLARSNERILIHASKGMTRAEYDDFLSTIHHISINHPFPGGLIIPPPEWLPRGGIVGSARIANIVNSDSFGPDRKPSPWFFGPTGLVLADVEPTNFVPPLLPLCAGASRTKDRPDMTEALKSPTCRDCALEAGYVTVISIHTVTDGICANCGKEKRVSSIMDWKLPGKYIHPEAID